MSRPFGGKDPFDDPFFSRPLGSLFGLNASSGLSSRVDNLKRPMIEELNSDDEDMYGNGDEQSGNGDKRDAYRQSTSSNKNPLVEHPEDQISDHDKIESKGSGKELSNISQPSHHSKLGARQTRDEGVSFQRVTYGGINGTYYNASTTRRTGEDGVILEERREADTTTGQATHRISKGIHDKGHSIVRKLNSDGNVDTTQTLHNLGEDELASFEQSWKGNADTHIPGWDNGFNFPSTAGAGSSRLASWSGRGGPFRNMFNRNAGVRSSEGRPKKVVTIPIE